MDHFALAYYLPDGGRRSPESRPYWDPADAHIPCAGLTVYQDGVPILSYAHPDTEAGRAAIASEDPAWPRTRTSGGLVQVNP